MTDASPPPRPRGPRRLRLGLLLVTVVVGAVGLFWAPWSSTPRSLRPSETQWGQRLRDRRLARRPPVFRRLTFPDGSAEEAAAELPLRVHRVAVPLSEVPLEDWRFEVDTQVVIGPQDYWPTLEEAPWPDLDSADSIQTLAAALRSETTPVLGPLGEFIEDAESEGLLDFDLELEIEDPWLALLAMQAAHVHSFADAGGRNVDHTRSIQVAEAILADMPNDPAADYARLHLLQVANADWAVEHDPEDAVGRVLDLIEFTEDQLVLEVAMSELSRMDSVQMDPETLREIAAAMPEVDADIQESLAILGMNQTVRQGQWEAATHWSEVYSALIEPSCPEDGRSTDPLCASQRQALGAFEARRAQQGGMSTTGWREELTRIVQACVLELLEDATLDAPAQAEALQGKARWEDGWQWQSWGRAQTGPEGEPEVEAVGLQPLTDCLDDHAWEHPPAEPVRLQLSVHLAPAVSSRSL